MGVSAAGSVVLGATGLVGRAVAALLAERGGPVAALTRRPVGLAGVAEHVVDFYVHESDELARLAARL